MFISKPPKYSWSHLFNDGKFIVDEIISKWNYILKHRLPEEEYHNFISEYSGFFFSPFRRIFFTISKLRLGSDFVVDFVVPKENYSLGLTYELIEFKPPYHQPFTKKGIQSARLSEAINQILSWKEWIKDNRSEATKIFPASGIRLYGKPNFSFKIVIGRRNANKEWIDRRIALGKQLNIEIRSYDYLTDLLKERMFFDEAATGSAEDSKLTDYQKNQLANPFFKSFSDQQWRNLIKKEGRVVPHFVCFCAESIIENRYLNQMYFKFDKHINKTTRGNNN
jgi:hypothetical protein